MSKRTGTRTPVMPIKERDPEVETRDPVTPDATPQRQSPVIVRVSVPRCPACGYTVFREGGTSIPNITTREMLRYRKCAKCGKSIYFAVPMNDGQAAQYGV